jgi:hypothetical protein
MRTDRRTYMTTIKSRFSQIFANATKNSLHLHVALTKEVDFPSTFSRIFPIRQLTV